MKRSIISVVVPALLGVMFMVGASAAADAVLGVDVYSAYVSRGVTFNDGIVIQPSLDVSKDGFGVNVWGNLDIDDYDGAVDSGEFSEVDLTLSYSRSIDSVDLSLGIIEYVFPNAAIKGTAEVFVSGTINLPAGFAIGGTAYYDIDEIDDYYITVGPSYSYSINDKAGIEASVMLVKICP